MVSDVVKLPRGKDPKKCNTCLQEKPRTSFYKQATGVSANCKVCHNEISRKRQSLDPKKANLVSKKSKLKVNWGMTIDEFDALLATQNGGCGICGTNVPGGRGRFPIDHCHSTGRIRGLLCNNCNIGPGAFKDSIPALLKAIGWLTRGSA